MLPLFLAHFPVSGKPFRELDERNAAAGWPEYLS
jgi:hypothetical protein